MKNILIILALFILAQSCGGGSSGGSPPLNTVSDTQTIEDGTYKLIMFIKDYTYYTVTGTLTMELAYQGNGEYQRILDGNISATSQIGFLSDTEIIDCTVIDSAYMALNKDGEVNKADDNLNGCVVAFINNRVVTKNQYSVYGPGIKEELYFGLTPRYTFIWAKE